MVTKEEIELKENLVGEKKSNGINGHLESNNGDLSKIDISEDANGKKPS